MSNIIHSKNNYDLKSCTNVEQMFCSIITKSKCSFCEIFLTWLSLIQLIDIFYCISISNCQFQLDKNKASLKSNPILIPLSQQKMFVAELKNKKMQKWLYSKYCFCSFLYSKEHKQHANKLCLALILFRYRENDYVPEY